MEKNDIAKNRRAVQPDDDQELLQVFKPFLVYSLSLNHDLNNPLTGIMGYTEFLLMESDTLSTDQIELLKNIQKCSERIQKILEDLYDKKAAIGEKVNLIQLISEWQESEDPSD